MVELQDYPAPTSVRQVRAFLDTAGWLGEFIPRFSEKAAPLTDLISAKRKFKWTPAAQEVFDRKRTNHCVWPHPTCRNHLYYKRMRLRWEWRRYSSRRVTRAKEIKRYRPYLEHRRFILRTDSRSLIWLDRLKESKQKLVQWALFLQKFDFEVQHVAGSEPGGRRP